MPDEPELSENKTIPLLECSVTKTFHSVQSGDNLWNIAKSQNMTLDEIINLNPKFTRDGRSPNLIYPGEQVEIFVPNNSIAVTSKSKKETPEERKKSKRKAVSNGITVTARGENIKQLCPKCADLIVTVLCDKENGTPQGGVTVRISGPEEKETTSGKDGKALFPSIKTGSYNITVSIKGHAINDVYSISVSETSNNRKEIELMNYTRFDRTISYIYQEMLINSQSKDIINIRKNNLEINEINKKVLALGKWALLVRPGGRWDHKPLLEQRLNLKGPPPDYYFPIRGDCDYEYYYDIWSNIHYGYVGRSAGFDASILQSGASVPILAGTNDEEDELTIKIGIELWDTYKTALTQQQLHQAILKYKDKFSGLKKAITPTNRK